MSTRRVERNSFERRFADALARLPVGDWTRPRVWVAFSGGLDSTLLLNALDRAGMGLRLAAVHVDHRLHADSAAWASHCATQANALGIDFVSRTLKLARPSGTSLEAAAREARYEALARVLGPGDLLMTAHHADDQLETVLLRLLRGTGVRGLAAIHRFAPLGAGSLARPLLDFPRAEIEAQARAWQLDWLEDPSNADPGFDRNFLRANVLPRLHERWPQAGLVASRLARQMAEAESLLTERAAADLAEVQDPARIPLALLEALSGARRRNVLRHAARELGLPVPSAKQLAELERLRDARGDAEAVVTWPGAAARVYRGHLYLEPMCQGPPPAPETGRVDTETAWSGRQGRLRLVPADGYGIPNAWARQGLRVAFRAGGERFRPEGCGHHKTLKHWFQEAGIVPWMRGEVPLLYHGDRLIAVADLCVAGHLPQSSADAPFWRPVWTGHARLR